MTTIMPEGENIQKAIGWMSANLEENNKQPLSQLMEKAIFKFDLSPKEAEFLSVFFKNRQAVK